MRNILARALLILLPACSVLQSCRQLEQSCNPADLTCSFSATLLYAASSYRSCTALSGAVAAPGFFTFTGVGGATVSATSVCPTADGGAIWTGSASGDIPNLGAVTPRRAFAGGTDALVVKHAADGAIEWYTFLGSSAVDVGNAIATTRDGGYIVGGQSAGDIPSLNGRAPLLPYSGSNDGHFFKLSSSGDPEWYGFVGTASIDSLVHVSVGPDGAIALAGSVAQDLPALGGQASRIAYAGGEDVVLVKLSAAGALEWYALLGSSASESASDVSFTSSGAIYVCSTTNAAVPLLGVTPPLSPFLGGTDYWVIKLAGSGLVDWHTFAGTAAGTESALNGAPTADGGYAATGYTNSAVLSLEGKTPVQPYLGAFDALTIRYEPGGAVRWFTHAGSASGNDQPAALLSAADGSIYIGGNTGFAISSLGGKAPLRAYTGSLDGFLMRFDSAGALEWYTFAGDAGIEQLTALGETSDGGVYAVGNANGTIANISGKTALTPYIGLQAALLVRYTGSGQL